MAECILFTFIIYLLSLVYHLYTSVFSCIDSVLLLGSCCRSITQRLTRPADDCVTLLILTVEGCLRAAGPPCKTTWQNVTDRNLMVGGSEIHLTSSGESCAALCAYNISGCVAVDFYFTDQHCVVHLNEGDLQYMAPNGHANVYIMIFCNESRKAFTLEVRDKSDK